MPRYLSEAGVRSGERLSGLLNQRETALVSVCVFQNDPCRNDSNNRM